MAYGRRWRPSKSAIADFKAKMDEVREFCDEKGINYSQSMDSFYFVLNGQNYRVSNHSVEASNRHAFTEDGEQIRELYHEDGRRDDTIYIHASKTRVKEIYQNLEAGKVLDGRGNVK